MTAAAHLEVLVEDRSTEAAMRELLPRLVGPATFAVYPHQGKADLLNKLPARLRGYAAWLPGDYRVVVVLDRDDDDCRDLKARLDQMATGAGLRVRRGRPHPADQVVNRLAIEELEAWYFGDWEAVRRAYPKVSATIPSRKGFRDPDTIRGGTWEAFERVLKRAGYFKSGLRKIEAARAVAAHWNPDANRSPSFGAFRDAIREMVA